MHHLEWRNKKTPCSVNQWSKGCNKTRTRYFSISYASHVHTRSKHDRNEEWRCCRLLGVPTNETCYATEQSAAANTRGENEAIHMPSHDCLQVNQPPFRIVNACVAAAAPINWYTGIMAYQYQYTGTPSTSIPVYQSYLFYLLLGTTYSTKTVPLPCRSP